MLNKKKKVDVLVIVTVMLMLITSITGILSMNFNHKWEFENQYGHVVELYGYGIYSYDTYFKAPLNIGMDFTILLVVVPLLIFYYLQYYRKRCALTEMKMASVYGVITYYAASVCFGVTYNNLFLGYVVLFSIALFKTFWHIKDVRLQEGVSIGKGLTVFLCISGVSLFVAWFPDIVPTLFTGGTLPLIGTYTTEITYVLDMGIISPLIFTCLYYMKKKAPIGTIILDIILCLCSVVGIMIIFQSICQKLSNAEMPLVVIITKALIFIILGAFSMYFRKKAHQELRK